MLLNVGDVIQVEGFVMLKNIDDGCSYRLIGIREYNGNSVYDFAKGKRGRVRYVSHYCYEIDYWLNNNSDINYIKKI